MGKSSALRVQEMRAIIGLVNDCRDLGDDFDAWCNHYTSTLARLTGAGFGMGGILAYSPRGVEHRAGATWGWENGFDRRAFVQAMAEHGGQLTVSPLTSAYFRLTEGVDDAGLTRRDLVSDRDRYAFPFHRIIQEPTGLGHTLASLRTLPGGAGLCMGVTLARLAAEPRDFSLRERALVGEAQAAVAPLIGSVLVGHDEASPAGLTPRTRQVLRCLLEGDGDKQIAARLKMSKHTANDHTKAIFAHFNVSSRAELLARWVRRGWGRRFGWADE